MALFDNCVAAYKLDDLTDATGRGNTLTNNNSATFNTGKIGNAAYLVSGSSQFLSRASNSDLQTGNVDFTIALWVYLGGTANSIVAIAKRGDAAGSSEYVIYFDNSANRFIGGVFAATDSFKSVTANNFGAPSAATWYCIIMWYDSVANTINISVNDGTADSASTGGAVQAASTAAFSLGRQGITGGELYWDGRIDNVNKWTRVLSSGERTSFYNGGSGVEFSSTNPTINPPGSVPIGKAYPVDLRTFLQTTDIQLIGKDSFFGAAGESPKYDWPNPRGPLFPIDLRTFLNPIELPLLGKDKFFGAAGQAPANLDWPVPKGPYPTHLRTWNYNSLQNTLRNQDQFFGTFGQGPANLDWPIPKGRDYPSDLRTFVSGTDIQLIGQDKMFGAAGQVPTYQPPPNPIGKAFPHDLRTFINGIEVQLIGQDTLFGAPGQTITYNWTVPAAPRAPIELRSWWQNLLQTTLGVILPMPFNLNDWPNPRGPIASILLRTFTDFFKTNLQSQDQFYGTSGQAPANLDWPVPKGKQYPSDLRTYVNGSEIQLIGQDQMFGAPGEVPSYDWPNPIPKRPAQPFNVINLLGTTLKQIISVMPFRAIDWPNPLRRTEQTWLRTFLGQLGAWFNLPGAKIDVTLSDASVNHAASSDRKANRLKISEVLVSSVKARDNTR